MKFNKMSLHLKVIFIAAVFSTTKTNADKNAPIVTTPYGKVKGTFSTSYSGATYSQFLGIPYAQPPIGNLRFREPQPLEKWRGIWNANTTSICAQISEWPEPEGGYFAGDEDCLHLNIFVPRKNPTEGELLNVFVHIHGGAFNFGSGTTYAGPKYFMDVNAILVNFNYRLGPLGFLSTEDDVVPGNNGMKDQVAALRWIKENIQYFGGNSESIVITGLSAGGASVHYHYLSPLSRGLFKAGISVSGTALTQWSLQENPLEKAQKLGAALGCTPDSITDLIECLKQRSAKQIVESTRMFRPWLYNPFSAFGIVVEKSGNSPFLPDHPYRMLVNGQVADLPWITSVTSEEGIYPAADYAAKEHYLSDLNRRWDELAPFVLDYNYTVPVDKKEIIAEKVKQYYLKGKEISQGTFPELIQMIGDRHFVVPAEKAAKLQAKVNKSPVYYYYFTYPGEKVLPLAILMTGSPDKHGVGHGDDMMYMFTAESLPLAQMTKLDRKMQNLLFKIWLTFAKSGSPGLKNVKWLPVSKNTEDPLNYLHIKSPDKIVMKNTKEMGHISFWKSLKFLEDENLFDLQKDEL